MITEYKIAVATNDGIHINQSFGQTSKYYIYVVDDSGVYCQSEIREISDTGHSQAQRCSDSSNTGAACGCGHESRHDERADMLSDCRAVLCMKIGPKARKILEHRAISVFDVSMDIEEAFAKIIQYFTRVDKHMPLK